jgi:hypothetical protein
MIAVTGQNNHKGRYMDYRKLSGTDREKIKWVAKFFEVEYDEKPKSIIVTSWKRRFTFNKADEIVKIQDVQQPKDGKAMYTDSIS